EVLDMSGGALRKEIQRDLSHVRLEFDLVGGLGEIEEFHCGGESGLAFLGIHAQSFQLSKAVCELPATKVQSTNFHASIVRDSPTGNQRQPIRQAREEPLGHATPIQPIRTTHPRNLRSVGSFEAPGKAFQRKDAKNAKARNEKF